MGGGERERERERERESLTDGERERGGGGGSFPKQILQTALKPQSCVFLLDINLY